MNGDLNKKIVSATKWSAITEILAKLVTPIISIVLAHLLAPEVFGVVTTLTMIIAFAEIFTDAGFQKYIIQHEFQNKGDLYLSVNVAFWSNIAMALFIWLIISLFSETLATIVGNPGLGHVLIIACSSIPLIGLSGIQMALYRRNLDFKTLFKVRMVGIFVPLIITVPLAYITRSYWALILGTIAQNLINVIVLFIFSEWKPKIIYSFVKLKEMLSFTLWSIIEAIGIWLTSYVDIFIVGTLLSQYYLGLYKTSSAIVGQLMGLVTAVTTPILFSSLSRLQNDEIEFRNIFFKFQKYVSILVMPLGVGIFCYSDFITMVLLGEQWMETSGFIGLWGITTAFTIVLCHYCSEIYRSKGYPKMSAIVQWLHIIVLWPAILFAADYGYEILYVTRSLVRFQLVLLNVLIMYFVFHFSPIKLFGNITPAFLSAVVMGAFAVFINMELFQSILYQGVTIIPSVLIYFLVLCSFSDERKIFRTQILSKALRTFSKIKK